MENKIMNKKKKKWKNWKELKSQIHFLFAKVIPKWIVSENDTLICGIDNIYCMCMSCILNCKLIYVIRILCKKNHTICPVLAGMVNDFNCCNFKKLFGKWSFSSNLYDFVWVKKIYVNAIVPNTFFQCRHWIRCCMQWQREKINCFPKFQI